MNDRSEIDTIPGSTSESSAAPYLVTSRYGVTFDSREASWLLDGKNSINAGALRACVAPCLLEGLEATLREDARKYATATLVEVGTALKHYKATMFPTGQIERWHETDLRNYRARHNETFGHDRNLLVLRSFLRRWQALRSPGVAADTVKALEGMHLKHRETGRAVRTMDPDQGPLLPDELHHLTRDIYRAAEDGRLELEELSLATFHIVTGRRPGQSAALKCKDVDRSRKADAQPGQTEGEALLLLHVPRAKQMGHGFRETRRSVHLIAAYFELFERQRDVVQARLRQQLDVHAWALQPQDVDHLLDNLPLYPSWRFVRSTIENAAELRDSGQHAQGLQMLRCHAEGIQWHLHGDAQLLRLQRIVRKAGTISRDGKPLRITALRLRHTKGTELARQGAGLDTLAWLLDHSTIENAGIYIDNLPEHAAQINAAMCGSLTLLRFASLFCGRLVDREADALAGEDPLHSRLHYQGTAAATCGKRKQCGLGGGIPLACYTCDHFQPWLDGPHEAVLGNLLHERRRLDELCGAAHPATTRRDTTVIAVINVIQRCHARREEMARMANASQRI
jgi:integrase